MTFSIGHLFFSQLFYHEALRKRTVYIFNLQLFAHRNYFDELGLQGLKNLFTESKIFQQKFCNKKILI